jgi:hypothetical protein
MKNTSTVLWDVVTYIVPSFEMQVNFFLTTHEHIPEDDTLPRLHGSHVIMKMNILPLATSWSSTHELNITYSSQLTTSWLKLMYKMYMVNICWYLVNIASKLYITSPQSELKFPPTKLLISYTLVQNYFDLNYIHLFNTVIAIILKLFYVHAKQRTDVITHLMLCVIILQLPIAIGVHDVCHYTILPITAGLYLYFMKCKN